MLRMQKKQKKLFRPRQSPTAAVAVKRRHAGQTPVTAALSADLTTRDKGGSKGGGLRGTAMFSLVPSPFRAFAFSPSLFSPSLTLPPDSALLPCACEQAVGCLGFSLLLPLGALSVSSCSLRVAPILSEVGHGLRPGRRAGRNPKRPHLRQGQSAASGQAHRRRGASPGIARRSARSSVVGLGL